MTLSCPIAQSPPPVSSVGSRHASLDPTAASSAFLCDIQCTEQNISKVFFLYVYLKRVQKGRDIFSKTIS